jgi:hypothetical protein
MGYFLIEKDSNFEWQSISDESGNRLEFATESEATDWAYANRTYVDGLRILKVGE